MIKEVGQIGQNCVYCSENEATHYKFGINEFIKADGELESETWAVCDRCNTLMDEQIAYSATISLQIVALKQKDLKMIEMLDDFIKKSRKRIRKMAGNLPVFTSTVIKNKKGKYDFLNEEFKEV